MRHVKLGRMNRVEFRPFANDTIPTALHTSRYIHDLADQRSETWYYTWMFFWGQSRPSQSDGAPPRLSESDAVCFSVEYSRSKWEFLRLRSTRWRRQRRADLLFREFSPLTRIDQINIFVSGAHADSARIANRRCAAIRRMGGPSRQKDQAADRVARVLRSQREAVRGHLHGLAQIQEA